MTAKKAINQRQKQPKIRSLQHYFQNSPDSAYAAELKEHIAQHEGTAGNERPLWICQNCQDRAQDIFQQSCLDPPIIAIKQI